MREYSKHDKRKVKRVMLKKVVITPKVKLPKLKKSKRRIDYLVLHCSATKQGYEFDKKDIDRWHKNRGWSGIGYHYVVKLDGTVELGRDVHKIGAHVGGHNRYSIGICYIGGLDQNMKPKDTRTPSQKRAIKALLRELRKFYPKTKIQGHRDFPKVAKACPCFDAKKEYSKV